MALHPEAQAKAQKELDEVVGRDRLPDFSDKENLPYVDLVIKETLRWFPFAPLGIPHMASEDDEYEGHFIPKGTTIVANAW